MTRFLDFDTVLIVAVLAVLGLTYRGVIRYGRDRRAPVALLVVAGLNALSGLASGMLGSGHLVAVTGRALRGQGLRGAEKFAFDFTFYSLILVGVVVALPGFICLLHSRALTRGDPAAWQKAAGWSGWLFVVNAPLFGDFAPLLAIFALLNLTGLLACRKQFRTVLAASAP